MCGIAGILENPGKSPARSLLLEMAGELRHRGPDGCGLFLHQAFGMVNTRLSIVDLEGGDQPIPNEDRRYWVVQNGEIYNSPELTEVLREKGHSFRTHCDTEVIVHAYEEWGTDCLSQFNGPFAFAIWDTLRGELFVARDRLGIRPLFIAECKGRLLFASEGKALLRHPDMPRQIDPTGLHESFELWATGPERSAFVGVRELPPGHYLLAKPGEAPRIHAWWDLSFRPSSECRTEPVEDLADELYALLEDATKLRLRADVPVGAYLSGGLDSSATAAMVRRLTSKTLRSFSIQFQDPRFDERTFQTQMAGALGTDLSSVEISADEIGASMREVVRLGEKPLLRTAPAPMFRLSRLVKDSNFKVVLTGEGADEMFAGYQIFQEDKIRRFWAKAPKSTMRSAPFKRLYPYLAHDLGRTGGFLAGFFGRHLEETDDLLYSHRLRFENTARMQVYLSEHVRAVAATHGTPTGRLIERLPAAFPQFSPLGRAQYLEIKTFLQGYLIHGQGDRMLMGNGVEGRFPFLDHRVAEFAATIPDKYRIRGLKEKYLLRRSVGHLLPKEILARPKLPYRAPILQAFFGENAPRDLRPLVAKDRLNRSELFDAERVERLVSKLERSPADRVSETDQMAFVGILSTMLLHDTFVENPVLMPPYEPKKEERVNERT